MNWSSLRSAVTKVSVVDVPGVAPVLMVKVQSMMSPSGMVTRSPAKTNVSCPALGVAAFSDLPALTPAALVQLAKLRTAVSKLMVKGLPTVTIFAPFLVSEIGTVT